MRGKKGSGLGRYKEARLYLSAPISRVIERMH